MTAEDSLPIVEDISKGLQELAPHTRIIRHEPGNITLKIMLSGLSAIQNAQLDRLIQCVPGIRDTKVKFLSRSITIDYDPKRIPPAIWEAVLGGPGMAGGKTEIQDHVRAIFEEEIA